MNDIIRGYVTPMMDCPRFYACSASICPLDPKMPWRKAFGGIEIKESKCTLTREKRMELGGDLPWKGLWAKELAGANQWKKSTTEDHRQFALKREKTQFPTVF